MTNHDVISRRCQTMTRTLITMTSIKIQNLSKKVGIFFSKTLPPPQVLGNPYAWPWATSKCKAGVTPNHFSHDFLPSDRCAECGLANKTKWRKRKG